MTINTMFTNTKGLARNPSLSEPTNTKTTKDNTPKIIHALLATVSSCSKGENELPFVKKQSTPNIVSAIPNRQLKIRSTTHIFSIF
jgi:hypothetical protein